MPTYSYSNPSNEDDIVDVFQSMNDIHELIIDGIKWNRVYYVPQASIDANINPFDNKAFIEKTGKARGSVGSIMDRSKDLSLQRAEKNGGKDPLKEKYIDRWKKERKNRKVHPSEISRKIEITS